MTAPELRVEYCGEWYIPDPDRPFVLGRTGDLDLDDNPYLHRHFLELAHVEGLWTIRNVGDRLGATLVDGSNLFHGHLRSGAVMPIVFGRSSIRFGAGPTTYEVNLLLEDPPLAAVDRPSTDPDGTRTMGSVALTPDQRLCIIALAEPTLRRGMSGASQLPQSRDAADRLGWTLTKFNRKLDNVCQKLSRAGVKGLHGTEDSLASNRRARLVEYSLASQLVTLDDLDLLDPTPPHRS